MIGSQQDQFCLVNSLVEDEIHNGIPPSRIVSDRNFSVAADHRCVLLIADDRWVFDVSVLQFDHRFRWH